MEINQIVKKKVMGSLKNNNNNNQLIFVYININTYIIKKIYIYHFNLKNIYFLMLYILCEVLHDFN